LAAEGPGLLIAATNTMIDVTPTRCLGETSDVARVWLKP